MPNIVSAVALATMWLQAVYSPQFGLLKTFFKTIGLDSLAKIQWLDADHKFWGAADRVLLWYGRLPHADMEQRNRAYQHGLL